MDPDQVMESHLVGLIALKAELDRMIRIEFTNASRGQLPDSSKPFRITKPVEHAQGQLAEMNRRTKEVIAILEAARSSVPQGEWTSELIAIQDNLIGTLQASVETARKQLVYLERLATAFNDARLDMYGAIQAGRLAEARLIVQTFLRRPAIAP